MTDRPHKPALPDIVSDQRVAQLLARASELDAARNAGAQVAELRAAAIEAGISGESFDTALAEMRHADDHRDEHEVARRKAAIATRQRWVPIIIAGLVLMVAAVLVAARIASRRAAKTVATAPMLDEAILLRCLPAGEAATLVRPLLTFTENSLVVNRRRAPRVLTVHATAAQLSEIKALLAKYENDAASCPVPATAPAPDAR